MMVVVVGGGGGVCVFWGEKGGEGRERRAEAFGTDGKQLPRRWCVCVCVCVCVCGGGGVRVCVGSGWQVT